MTIVPILLVIVSTGYLSFGPFRTNRIRVL
jgi:hypothetical protein